VTWSAGVDFEGKLAVDSGYTWYPPSEELNMAPLSTRLHYQHAGLQRRCAVYASMYALADALCSSAQMHERWDAADKKSSSGRAPRQRGQRAQLHAAPHGLQAAHRRNRPRPRLPDAAGQGSLIKKQNCVPSACTTAYNAHRTVCPATRDWGHAHRPRRPMNLDKRTLLLPLRKRKTSSTNQRLPTGRGRPYLQTRLAHGQRG
jgi:hypothetical protein